jgi:hypothetical protein
MTERIALAEATVSVLGEGRVVGYCVFEIESAEPTIGHIEMDRFTRPSLGADTEAVADDQHAHHQLGVDRWAACVAVERPQVSTQLTEV